MRFTASAFLGLALLVGGSGGWGQTGGQAPPPPQPDSSPEMTQDEKDAWSYFYLEEVLQRSCDDPTLRSAIALPQPKLTLETSAEGTTKVKAHVGVEVKKKLVVDLVVTSPISSSGETTLADLNGLSTGSTATLHFSRFWVPWESQHYKKALEETKTATADVPDKAESWHLTDYLNPVISRPSAVAMFGQKKRDEILRIWQDNMNAMEDTVWVATLDANAEQKEFQAGNSQPGTAKESHTDFKLTASGGAYFKGNYASLNYRRGTEFKAAQTGSPPKSQTAEALEFEIRRFFGTFGGGAHLTRDLQANVTTVELPFYFLSSMGSSGMELNGGIAVKWQSDTRKFSIVAFIGPALSKVLRMPGASTKK